MSDQQRKIYQTEGDRYEALISREDYQGNILRAIDEIINVDGLDVLDLGAGGADEAERGEHDEAEAKHGAFYHALARPGSPRAPERRPVRLAHGGIYEPELDVGANPRCKRHRSDF